MRATAAALLLLAALPARAQEPHATFALIIGVNQSVDPELPALRYADDDAARYLDLFRTLGARTYLLARLDENTSRLHPQALAEAMLPRKEEFDRAVADLAQDVAHAKEQGVATEVFFVYAGHGNVRDGQGYISLEDARLTGRDLSRALLDQIPATRIHFIIDACYSFLVAYGRGPGGQRRPLEEGFSQAMQLSTDPRVGLLLSTSSARESHEWEGIQGGVFSHEVRSGLYGAADADGDGEVSYREIAAFVQRANAAIPNERFRPDVWARPPLGSGRLLDLHAGLAHRLEIDGEHAARYLLEDNRGVRLADFHNAQGQALTLVRPLTSAGMLYLRRISDEREFAIAPGPEVVAIAALTPQEPRVKGRGAAHEAFERLFELPFDRAFAEAFSLERPVIAERARDPALAPAKIAGLASYGLAVAGVAGGTWSYLATKSLGNAPANESQADAAARNQRISRGNTTTIAVFCVAGAAAVAGTVLMLVPEGAPTVALVPGPNGAMASISGGF